MESPIAETSGSGSEDYPEGVRLVVLNLPEDEGEGLGFRLTRTLWDPYPWVREVVNDSRADVAGLKTGDCLLQADGKDLLGLPVGQVAGLIRGDGQGRGVSLLVWNCGVDPNDDPELLWSCGGGSRGERSRRALSGVVRALACCVCAATAARALHCARSHLYCEACWCRLERCALCREQLPPKDSPYARNLVAEQVFEAIAIEYEIKDTLKKPTESVSAYTSPNRSPNMSPATSRKGQYHLSKMGRHKRVQFNDKFGPNYVSDPNIHRSLNINNNLDVHRRRLPTIPTNIVQNPSSGNTGENGGKSCSCQSKNGENGAENLNVPKISVEDFGNKCIVEGTGCCQNLQHKLVARLRQACSMADLSPQGCSSHLTGSLNNVSSERNDCCNGSPHHSNSLDNLKKTCNSNESPPVFVLSAPPIYVLACDHK